MASSAASMSAFMRAHQRETTIDGARTNYFEAGSGTPVVLLHGGEFGGSAELAWEDLIAPLSRDFRVLAPDMLGFGHSEKAVSFVDGRGFRTRHLARFCEHLGVESAHFVGNSMGAILLLTDGIGEAPRLPARTITAICGGGEIQKNEHMSALIEYDGSFEAMRALVRALFHSTAYGDDDAYVYRRHGMSLLPGAWESVASARFRRPLQDDTTIAPAKPVFANLPVPALFIEGRDDKLLPGGWAAAIAAQTHDARSLVIDQAGHCPQIEQPDAVLGALRDFLLN
ncbi:alpha/beta fold hydrolase [Arthrobacter sp. D1-29]